MEFISFVWLGLMIIFICVEMSTISLVSGWFAIGSLVAFILSFFYPDAIVMQILVSLLISLALLIGTRPFVKKVLIKRQTPTNADMVIGKIAQVTETISLGEDGRVLIAGLTWKASAKETININEWCVIKEIVGATLVVERREGN